MIINCIYKKRFNEKEEYKKNNFKTNNEIILKSLNLKDRYYYNII